MAPPCNGQATDAAAILGQFSQRLGAMIEGNRPVGLELVRQQLGDATHYPVPVTAPHLERLDASTLYTSCCESVVVVGKVYKCDKCGRWHTTAASGFAIAEDGVIVTSYHVVAQDERSEGIAVRTWDGRLMTVRNVLAASKTHDLVILRVDGDGLVPLPIRDEGPIGSEVFCISHPVSRFYTMTQGIVAGYYRGKRRTEMAITADFAKGSSGAPVLDSTGAVVGIARATSTVYHEIKDGVATQPQMVWKYCVPSAGLLELLW